MYLQQDDPVLITIGDSTEDNINIIFNKRLKICEISEKYCGKYKG